MENQEPSAGVVLNQRGRPSQQPRRRMKRVRRPLQGSGTTATSVVASTSAAPATAATSSQATSGTSTGKRLAKRSIIGTRICAPGEDGKYYCGAISKLETPPTHQEPEIAGLNITSDTRFLVRFDPVPPGCKAPDSKTEYTSSQLIGPGFGSVTTAKLVQGQRVYLTYNGREIQAEVLEHQQHNDEVQVVFTPPGLESAITLLKRIDEVRLLESRKSARLADTDTDFARLADVGSDRKRGSAHSIEVPQVYGSRKRRTSSNSESNYYFVECASEPTIEESPPTIVSTTDSMIQPSGNMRNREDCMDMCRAAVALLSLSTSPKDPLPHHCQYMFESWEEQQQASAQEHPHHQHPARASPGVGGSSPSSGSWRSGTPSPPLSDQGTWTGSSSSMSNGFPVAGPSRETHKNTHRYSPYRGQNSRRSPYDEGIFSDMDNGKHPRKKQRCKAGPRDEYANERTPSPCSPSPPSPDAESTTDCEVEAGPDDKSAYYKCSWRTKGDHSEPCGFKNNDRDAVAAHVLTAHLGGIIEHQNDEDFYILDEQFQPPAPAPQVLVPTASHWDMVRPISEDPEYQESIRLDAAAIRNPDQNHNQVAATLKTHDIIIRDVFSIAQPQSTPIMQVKPSPRPSPRPLQTYNSNVNVLTVSIGKMPSAPRRARGETKKCRKHYGMDHKDQWCTQCKWKKACSRFTD